MKGEGEGRGKGEGYVKSYVSKDKEKAKKNLDGTVTVFFGEKKLMGI